MKTFIFDGEPPQGPPNGFNAVSIALDCGLKSPLLFKEEQLIARKKISEGWKIFWQLDLGLLNALKHPLAHQAQFLSLKLSLTHFVETLWQEFAQDSVGISLYRGSLDFTKGYLWDKEEEENLSGWLQESYAQFSDFTREKLVQSLTGVMLLQLYCRSSVAEYMDILASQLPEEANLCVILKTEGIADPAHLLSLLSKEHFPQFTRLVSRGNEEEGFHSDTMYLGKTLPLFPPERPCLVGLCVPPQERFYPSAYPAFHQVLDALSSNNIRYKPIAESCLITEWEGLDFIVVNGEFLTSSGKRMLMGFCAAGGCVVTCQGPLGFSEEISLEELFDKKM